MAPARLLFGWDPAKAASNVVKHKVTFERAMAVFHDPLALSRTDDDSVGEERWITLGRAAAGELLVVVHTYDDGDPEQVKIRIISARSATRREAAQYRDGGIR